MSSGLSSGLPGLNIGVSLYRGTASLWSGATGFITAWSNSGPVPPGADGELNWSSVNNSGLLYWMRIF